MALASTASSTLGHPHALSPHLRNPRPRARTAYCLSVARISSESATGIASNAYERLASRHRSEFLGRKGQSLYLAGAKVWRGRAAGAAAAQKKNRHNVEGVRCLFTGIVEEVGTVKEVKEEGNDRGYEMTIQGSVVLEDVKLGDSIAVNGTCLTVTKFDAESFSVGLAPETLRKTSLGEAGVGAAVNLERSLQPSSRMGGHFVQGHVDGTGTIASLDPEEDSLWVKIKTSPELLRYIVPKGYISVDGTSLTVVNVLDDESAFTFMLVAYTQDHIVLPKKKIGSKVNLEVDIVGKYVERMLGGYKVSSTT